MAGESDGESSYHRGIVNDFRHRNPWNDNDIEDDEEIYENIPLDSEDEEYPPSPPLPATTRPSHELQMDENGTPRGNLRRRRVQAPDQPRNHVVIVIPEVEEPEQPPERWPMGMYFKVLNYMGCIPYRIGNDFEQKVFCGMLPYKILHVFIGIYTLAQLFRCFMYGVYLTGSGTSRVEEFIGFGLRLLKLFFRVAVIYTFNKRFHFYKKAMKQVHQSEYRAELYKTSNVVAVSVYLLFGLVLCTVHTLSPDGWSNPDKGTFFANLCKHYFKVFIYSVKSFNYEEYLDSVKHNSSWPTGIQIPVGVVALLTDIYSRLIELAGTGLLILTARIMHQCSDEFHCLIPDAVDPDDDREHDDITQHYRQLRKLSKVLNMPINVIYPLFLAVSALSVAAFYSSSLNPNVKTIDKVLALLYIANPALLFYHAERASNRIEQFKEWLHDDSEMLMEEKESSKMIDQLTAFPIGFGRGIIYIDKGFIFSFALMTSTYFLSIVETRIPT